MTLGLTGDATAGGDGAGRDAAKAAARLAVSTSPAGAGRRGGVATGRRTTAGCAAAVCSGGDEAAPCGAGNGIAELLPLRFSEASLTSAQLVGGTEEALITSVLSVSETAVFHGAADAMIICGTAPTAGATVAPPATVGAEVADPAGAIVVCANKG
jgi:hypothetical protein